jgi:hypothetical protein
MAQHDDKTAMRLFAALLIGVHPYPLINTLFYPGRPNPIVFCGPQCHGKPWNTTVFRGTLIHYLSTIHMSKI